MKLKHYLIIAALLQLLWGLVPSASQFVIREIPIELYIAFRWSISGLIFISYLVIAKKWVSISARQFMTIFSLGILSYGIASLGGLYGLKIGGVTNFSLMSSFGPVFTVLASIIVLKEKPHKIFYLALPVSLVGLLMLVMGKYQISSLSIVGLSAVCILASGMLESLAFVYSKRMKERISVFQYLAIAQMGSAIFMWTLQGLFFHQTTEVYNLSTKGIISLFFVSLVACVFCYAVLYWLLNYIEGHRLALFDALHVISATFFGYLLFQENITSLMYLGGALALTGLVAGNWPKQKASAS